MKTARVDLHVRPGAVTVTVSGPGYCFSETFLDRDRLDRWIAILTVQRDHANGEEGPEISFIIGRLLHAREEAFSLAAENRGTDEQQPEQAGTDSKAN